MNYKPEIDGLRAVAILLVVIYHAGLGYLPGGYIGVDVFFVISGYLITTIINQEIDSGKFSIAKFYERRIRRIAPALIVVLLISIVISLIVLPPNSLLNFSKSLIATTLASSNILFLKTIGYFDSSTELKPLIHTWSLSLEEQAYLLLPPIIILAGKFKAKIAIVIMLFIIIASIFLSKLLTEHHSSFVFYMLPARLWEFLFGSILFYLTPFISNNQKTKISHELLCMLGILLILVSAILFNDKTQNIYMLSPVIGAALIIIFAKNGTFIGRLLSTKLMVKAGLLSYGVYLWHQPIFAFAREWDIEKPGKPVMVALGALSFILAYFSWKYIEIPFRDKSKYSGAKIINLTSFFAFLILLVGGGIYLSRGLPQRYFATESGRFLIEFDNELPEWKYFEKFNYYEKYRFDCNFYDIRAYRDGMPTSVPVEYISSSCYTPASADKNSLMIWGDSHAQQLYFGLKNNLPKNWQLLQVASSGCKPEIIRNFNKDDYCKHSNYIAYQAILNAKPSVVVIGQEGGHNVQTMIAIAKDLYSIGTKKIIFTGPTPHWSRDLPVIAYHLWDNLPKRTLTALNIEYLKKDGEIKKSFPRLDYAEYISVIDYFCNADGCQIYLGDNVTAGITSPDYGHLTPTASNAFAKNILVNSIINNKQKP
jgi:peptidoglycan/LPS O-acetylase OafA/YrhL